MNENAKPGRCKEFRSIGELLQPVMADQVRRDAVAECVSIIRGMPAPSDEAQQAGFEIARTASITRLSRLIHGSPYSEGKFELAPLTPLNQKC